MGYENPGENPTSCGYIKLTSGYWLLLSLITKKFHYLASCLPHINDFCAMLTQLATDSSFIFTTDFGVVTVNLC